MLGKPAKKAGRANNLLILALVAGLLRALNQ